jgi:hypothetical protein
MDAFWITALILSVLLILREMFLRIKYSNRAAFWRKHERLHELNEAISRIESDNYEAMEIIKAINLDADIDDSLADRLIKYRDEEDALHALKKEQRKIEKYLLAALTYI